MDIICISFGKIVKVFFGNTIGFWFCETVSVNAGIIFSGGERENIFYFSILERIFEHFRAHIRTHFRAHFSNILEHIFQILRGLLKIKGETPTATSITNTAN